MSLRVTDGEGVASRVVKWTAVVSAASVALSLMSLFWPGWKDMPITFRFGVGLTAFGVSPGLLVVVTLLKGRVRTVGDFFISVVTCSFSCNLIFNIVLFALEWSMAEVTKAYLIAQGVTYLGLALWRLRRGPASRSAHLPQDVPLERGLAATAVVLAIAMGAVIYANYVNGSPLANSEELVWLRKLAENPSVRFDNLSFRQGEPSTYLFVPFQILIVGTSTIAAADVAFTYSAFWAVSTALSLLVITRLAYLISGQPGVAALACLWMCAIGFFDPHTVVNTAGIAAPYPNRYGFAGGVLLPLTLVLFWSILRDPQLQAWRWGLLVYVTLEMTFVHARETLLSLGAIAAVLVVMAGRPKGHGRHMRAMAAVVGVTGLILLAYKWINLSVAPQLATYVAGTTEACRVALAKLMAEHRGVALLLADVPRSAVVDAGSVNAVRLVLPNYRNLFIEPWTQSFAGRLFLPITFLILPLFAWHGRSIAELSLAAALGGLGTVALSGLLTLFVSTAVGNPEVLYAYNLIFLLSLLVLCSATWSAGAWAGEWSTRSKGTRAGLAAGLLVASCLVLLCGAFLGADRIATSLDSLSALWGRKVGVALVGATFASILVRLARGGLPLFPSVRPARALGAFVSVSLILAVVMPAVRHSAAWNKSPFAPANPASEFTGDLFRDYSRLNASSKLDASEYPIEVIRYLRESVPANQTLLTGDALSLLERVPHFAAVLSNKGQVGPSYITNWEYLRKYSRTASSFELLPFLADDEGIELLGSMLTRYGVDLIVVSPMETAGFARAREEHETVQRMLNPVFEREGYAVYAVNRRTAPGAAGK